MTVQWPKSQSNCSHLHHQIDLCLKRKRKKTLNISQNSLFNGEYYSHQVKLIQGLGVSVK